MEFANCGLRIADRHRAYVLTLISLLACVLVSLVGCGYSLGHRAPPGVRTVAIPIFHNTTFPLRREVEFNLTSAVRQELQRRSSLRLVDSEDADMVLRGTILEFRETLLVEGDRDEKVESSVFAVVSLVLEDKFNGYEVELPRVTTSEPFSPSNQGSFESGSRSVVERLAERIVAAMEYWDDYEDEELSRAEN